MKLLLNGTRYDYFEIRIPRRSRKEANQPELATVTVFADEDETEIIGEWLFPGETLDRTEDEIIINDAIEASKIYGCKV